MDEHEEVYEKARQMILAVIEQELPYLDLSGDEFFYNLSKLPPEVAQANSLKSLALSSLGGPDLSALRGLKYLTHVHLRGMFPGDMNPLPLPVVEELSLTTKYAGLPVLSESPNVRRITLGQTDDRVDFHLLSHCPGLEVLDLSSASFFPEDIDLSAHTPKLKEFSAAINDRQAQGLRNLLGIEKLRLAGSKGLTEEGLRHFANMPNLQLLELDRSGVSDLAPVRTFVSARRSSPVLQELGYSETPVTERDQVLRCLSEVQDRRAATSLTLDYLRQREELQRQVGEDVAAARQRASDALADLQDGLSAVVQLDRNSSGALAPIGHNNPPTDEISEQLSPSRAEFEAVLEEVRKLKNDVDGLATPRGPEAATGLRAAFSRFLVVAKSVLVWAAKKADKAFDVAVAVETTQFVLGKSGLSELAVAFAKALAAVEHLVQSLGSLI